MEPNRIVEVLRATLNPSQREQAEQQLNEVRQFAMISDNDDINFFVNVSRHFNTSLTTDQLHLQSHNITS